MALNTYADISSFVNPIFEDALFIARENGIMANLVLNFDDMQGGAARKIQTYNSATVVAIGETDDLSSQSFTPTALSTLTPAEAGVQFFIGDLRVESDPFGVRNDAAVELGMAVADKLEDDLLNDMASLTGGTVGAAGTAITWGHVFAAKARLKAQKAPPPYYCVIHDYQWHVLAKAAGVGATVTNAPQFQDSVMQNWYVGTALGVNFFTSANLDVDSLDDAKGGLFSRSAIALDTRRPPRLEPERDGSRRGWELNMTTVYAHGVWRPAFGILMHFDASTPSS